MGNIRILLVNDDGYQAPGILAMLRALLKDSRYDVRVVAPFAQQSGTSHRISVRGTLFVERIEYPGDLSSVIAYKVKGTPADCVKVGLNYSLFGEWYPDLVISGINKGLNTGLNAYYSGTLAAAREGNFNGIPSIGISMAFLGATILHFENGADRAMEFINFLVEKIPENIDIIRSVCFNINLPNVKKEQNKKWIYTTQGMSIFKDRHIEQNRIVDEKGQIQKTEYVLNYAYEVYSTDESTCCATVAKGFCSVNAIPLKYDETAPSKEFSSWSLFTE